MQALLLSLVALGAFLLAWLTVWGAMGLLRFRARLRALYKLPHPEVGLLGIPTFKDKDHMPHFHTRMSEQLGGIYSCRLAHIVFVVVSDPALVHQVLSRQLNLSKDPLIFRFFNSLTSPGGRQPNMLGHPANDGYWKLVRKGVAPAFNPKNIRAAFEHVRSLADQLCAILAEAGPDQLVDLGNLLQRESMDVIGRVGFGTDFGALRSAGVGAGAGGGSNGGSGDCQRVGGGGNGTMPEQQRAAAPGAGKVGPTPALDADDVFPIIQGAAEEVAKRLTQPLRFRLRHILPGPRRGEWYLSQTIARMHRLLREVRSRGPPAEDDMSVAAHLLRIRDPQTGKPLTDEQLAGECGLFFFAGFETSGNTMAWVLYFLAQHPEAEARVCAELDALGLLASPARPKPRQLEYADLGRLRFLACVVKEAMRICPAVAAGTMRATATDMDLGGYRIPGGTSIYVAFHALQNSSNNWERPEEFDPDRWLEPGAEDWYGAPSGRPQEVGPAAEGTEYEPEAAFQEGEGGRGHGDSLESRAPKRFLPFGDGPRACVGQNLARANYMATLALLLSRFSFRLPDELKGPGALWDLQCNRITLQPKHGLPMRCIPRAAWEVY